MLWFILRPHPVAVVGSGQLSTREEVGFFSSSAVPVGPGILVFIEDWSGSRRENGLSSLVALVCLRVVTKTKWYP